MSIRTRIAVAAAVLLTAVITGCTVLLPTAAHAATLTASATAPQRAVGADPLVRTGLSGSSNQTLAGGAIAFIGTGVGLMIGISRYSRHH